MLNYFSTGNVLNNDTGLQLNNVEVLYTKVQRVYMKPEFKEERQTDLRVNVEVHAGISPVCRKVKYKQTLLFKNYISNNTIDDVKNIVGTSEIKLRNIYFFSLKECIINFLFYLFTFCFRVYV